MNATSRKFVGILALLLGLLVYIAGVVVIATTWLPNHWAIELTFYAVAGIAWAIPLRPFMAWMNHSDSD